MDQAFLSQFHPGRTKSTSKGNNLLRKAGSVVAVVRPRHKCRLWLDLTHHVTVGIRVVVLLPRVVAFGWTTMFFITICHRDAAYNLGTKTKQEKINKKNMLLGYQTNDNVDYRADTMLLLMVVLLMLSCSF